MAGKGGLIEAKFLRFGAPNSTPESDIHHNYMIYIYFYTFCRLSVKSWLTDSMVVHIGPFTAAEQPVLLVFCYGRQHRRTICSPGKSGE
jgi:hypothetical protein